MGVDDGFGPYLSSLNVPEFLHDLIANADEAMEVAEPKDSSGAGLWRIRRVAGAFSNHGVFGQTLVCGANFCLYSERH